MLHYVCGVFLFITGKVCCSGIEEIDRGEKEIEERRKDEKKRPTNPLALLKSGSRVVLS